MKNRCLLFAVILPGLAWSQSTISMQGMFQTPLPMGDFKETGGQTIHYGARFQLYVRPGANSPLQWGLDVGLFGRGQAEETVPLNVVGFQDDYRVTATNGVGNLGFLLKLQPWPKLLVSPYLEGTLGSNSFHSNVSIQHKKKDTGQLTPENDLTKGHWSFYYGGNAGLRIAFGKHRGGGIDLKCGYEKGSKTAYNAKPRFDDEGVVVLQRLRSTTDLLVPQIGLWIDFGAVVYRSVQRRKEGGSVHYFY